MRLKLKVKTHDNLMPATRLIFGTAGDAVILSDNDDLHYIGTQPVPALSPFQDDDQDDDVAGPPSGAFSDEFEDIDDLLATHSQKILSQTAPSLYSLSQKGLRASQLPPTSSATTTRGSRGVVAKKTKAQLELESQQRAEQVAKQARAEERKNAAARKVAKTMKPRKDDVSQLVDEFSELGSSQ